MCILYLTSVLWWPFVEWFSVCHVFMHANELSECLLPHFVWRAEFFFAVLVNRQLMAAHWKGAHGMDSYQVSRTCWW